MDKLKDLTKDELYALVQNKFKNVMDELQNEIKKNMDLYPALLNGAMNIAGFAIATMVRNEYVSKELALSMTMNDLNTTIDGFLEAFAHFDNLN